LRITSILHKSDKRGQPFCDKFGSCGGCQLQHLEKSAYQSWKQHQLDDALKNAGIASNASFVFWSELQQRRRVSLSYEKRSDVLLLGFYAHRSHRIEAIDSCPMLLPSLNKLIKPLREFLNHLCQNRQSGFVHLTQTSTGIDLSWSPSRFKSSQIHAELISSWSQFANEHHIARVTRAGKDLLIERFRPQMHWDNSSVDFPSASFLQPSFESERFMVQKALQWVNSCSFKPKAYYDLFCGMGTFSLPLLSILNNAPLASYDCDGPAIESLLKTSQLKGKWQVLKRDLFNNPLEHFEENSFVILDPPRQGAQTQIEALCQTRTSLAIVMISCDKDSFARDLATLTKAGFILKEAIGIDQFPWTYHCEAMAYLEKKNIISE
jgi:23S rRNA (uracil1939-C5)-methyltransferase